MRNTAKTISFTATLAWRHLRREPARVPLLALRVCPGGLRRVVRAVLLRTGGLARVYALWDAGNRTGSLDTLRRSAHGASPRCIARMVAFALAVERPRTARELLAGLPEGPRRVRLEREVALATGRALPSETPGRWPDLTVTPVRRTARYDTMNDGQSVPVTRVLHLVTNALPHTNAGYTQRTHRIALGQRASGMEPHVVTRLGYPLTKGIADARPRVRVEGVDYHRLLPWFAPADGERELRSSVRRAVPLVERLRPDVLHAASNHRNGRLALELGRRFGVPVVYEVRGFLEESWLSRDASRSTSDAFYREERRRETACMSAADLVVTLGRAMRDEIVARGIAPDRVLVVPNAVEEGFLEPLPSGSGVRDEWGVGPEEFVVGTTTSCYGYEGLDTLIDAVALLRGRGVPARALVVGDGPELDALRDHAAAAGVADSTHFPGRVAAGEIRRYHAAMDVFAVPRRDERVTRLVTPLKPVEAMAGGLPVVASDLPALRELVEHGETGELVDPGSSRELAGCLERLARDARLRAGYGRAGRARVTGERTWNAAARRYLDAYSALLGEKPLGPV
ncbi:glycosyltransferase family 4 protein [Haloactinospora alba]|uniref:glycosyltransferase family 4 protein n=1 Tax=Haloactinospora alba TaxID=405555 RepID=UPI001FEB96D6|nr:glycosyltransferase family 4 protein [Haloactinospora alba]